MEAQPASQEGESSECCPPSLALRHDDVCCCLGGAQHTLFPLLAWLSSCRRTTAWASSPTALACSALAGWHHPVHALYSAVSASHHTRHAQQQQRRLQWPLNSQAVLPSACTTLQVNHSSSSVSSVSRHTPAAACRAYRPSRQQHPRCRLPVTLLERPTGSTASTTSTSPA